MEAGVRRTLIELNLDLYRRFAGEFSGSRRRLQPGITRALASLGNPESLLDLGCGDARVGRALRAGVVRVSGGRWKGSYTGVDASEELLDLGRAAAASKGAPVDRSEETPVDEATGGFDLVQCDLAETGWSSRVPALAGGFDAMVLFSFLHHIPGAVQRREFLVEAASLLTGHGRWALSVWQFLHLRRFQSRIVPWSRIGLHDEDVDAGDVLLEWRRGGEGLRYVHAFEAEELSRLCEEAGYVVEEQFRSDGESGDLGLYLTGGRA